MCLYPKKAIIFHSENKLTGEIKSSLYFLKHYEEKKYNSNDIILIPCHNCFECCREYSNEWAYRIVLESKCHQQNCFITLTYEKNPEFLVKRDLQLFLKRLRKYLQPLKIRYFACGEYGSKNGRPHFHLIVFGWKPDDLEKFFIDDSGNQIYKSKIVSKLWNKGFVSVGDISLSSAKYCAKYMQKSFLDLSKFKVKPFTTMSLKPGIGLSWFLNNLNVLKTDKIFLDGYYIKIPKYFLDYAQFKLFLDLSKIKKFRLVKAKLFNFDEKQLSIKRSIIKEKYHIS